MIDSAEFSDIILELQTKPISQNKYRNVAGAGRSQAFGVVGRRCLQPDYSRNCWTRPYLYHLLLEFGKKHVKIPYTSITVNQSYKAAAHRDKGNISDSFLVAFGEYTGGELEVLEGCAKGVYDINRTPLVTDFSKALHQVKDFQGDRYSLVYYVAKKSEGLPPASVRVEGGKYIFYRGEEAVKGLPHPLKGRKRTLGNIIKEEKEVEIVFD